jgi:hypothetical protein
MLFGAIFLLAFSGGLANLFALRPEWATNFGIKEALLRLKAGLWGMAIIAWATVITGTFVVYPWYAGQAAGDAGTPVSLLRANPSTAGWDTFGMEWKQHVGWLAPIAATVVAVSVNYYGPTLAKKAGERNALLLFFLIAFGAAGVAGFLGALLNKVAPIR